MFGFQIAKQWFLAPPASGYKAVVYTLAAVVLPTLLRASVQGPVSGLTFETYFPFILLAAIALDWRNATVVAFLSAIVGSLFFIEPRFIFLAGPTDFFGIAVFLFGCAMIIGFAHALKGIIVDAPGSPSARHRQGVIFSAEDGAAWASWQGQSCSVRLGPQDEVAEMMQDFLAQRELGKRLEK